MAIILLWVKLILAVLITIVSPALGMERVPTIIGGLPVELGKTYKFPYQVLLYNQKYQFSCGGTLISTFHVLTAAHCVKNITANQIEITAGSSHPSRLGGSKISTEQQRTGAFVYIHEKYNFNTHVNDIALIRVETPFRFSSHVQNVHLPLPGEEFNGTATVSGWGYTTGDRQIVSKDLYYVDIPIVPYEKCRETYPSLRKDELCAGSAGHDHCKGDSGGPLTCKRSWSYEQILCGIVSKGTCGKPGFVGTNTMVSSFILWIKETKEKSDIDARNIGNNIQDYGNQFNKKPNVFADRDAKPNANAIHDHGNHFDKWKPTQFQNVYCKSFQFLCTENSKCIPESYKCNGYNDCPSGSDEYGCPNRLRSCSKYQFQCTEGSKCIPSWHRCDNYRDCPNGSDEVGCSNRNYQ